jgi:hypothetical protein
MILGTFRKTLTLGTVERLGDPSRACSWLNGWSSVQPDGGPGAGCAVKVPSNRAIAEDIPSLPDRPSGLPSRTRRPNAWALIAPKSKRDAWLKVKVWIAPLKDIRLRQAILRAPVGASVLIGARDHQRPQATGVVRSGPTKDPGGFPPDGHKPFVAPPDPCPAPRPLSHDHPAPGRFTPT